jgi:aminoglycoside phosphotransferase family enzyme/predicted kinase
VSQDEVIGFLSDGASYGRPGAAVSRIDTHISMVFLVEDRVFKLKRAVRFSYLDNSTPRLREQNCRRELDLNRRTAPALYLAVHAITRTSDGGLAFDGEGAAVDWVLEMRRFPDDCLFETMADAGKLTAPLMRDLTDTIAAFHARADLAPGGGRQAIADTIAGNETNLAEASPPLDRQTIDALSRASRDALAKVAALLDARRDAGKVRRCHGDLHLGNVCLFEDRPMPFDCIEFNDTLSCIDVLYDLAFLLMDLVERGLSDLANVVFNRYFDVAAERDGLAALPLFMSVRAAVRAHVLAAQDRQAHAAKTAHRAQSYLSLAESLLRPGAPVLIAVGGLSGTGKSTLARAIAPDFSPAPGARIVRSDVIRKRQADVEPEIRLPPSAYGPETTARVYGELEQQCALSLGAGYAAIADATFLREGERDAIASVAAHAGVRFLGLWLEAPAAVLTERIGARVNDASDADAGVLQSQLSIPTGPIAWHRLDAGSAPGENRKRIRALLDQMPQPVQVIRP